MHGRLLTGLLGKAYSGKHPTAAFVLCPHNSYPLGYEGYHCFTAGSQGGDRLGDPNDSQGKLFLLALSSNSCTAGPESWIGRHSPFGPQHFLPGDFEWLMQYETLPIQIPLTPTRYGALKAPVVSPEGIRRRRPSRLLPLFPCSGLHRLCLERSYVSSPRSSRRFYSSQRLKEFMQVSGKRCLSFS